MTSILELDHIGFLTRDLSATAEAMSRLGFTLARPSFHRERKSPDGPLEKTGTANQCIMFRQGYIELLGIVAPERYSGWITAAVGRYAGLHVVGFGHDDIEPLLADLEAQGKAPRVRRLTREVDIAGQSRDVAFTILFHDDAEFPEGRFVTMQHHTRDVLWHPSLLDHANGAVALAGVTLAVDDPAAFAARVSAWTGAPVLTTGHGARITLPGGFVDAVTPAVAQLVYGAALPDPLPPIIGMSVAVTDLNITAAVLSGVNHRAIAGGLLVPAVHAGGAFLQFIPSET